MLVESLGLGISQVRKIAIEGHQMNLPGRARNALMVVCVLVMGQTAFSQINIDVVPAFAPNGVRPDSQLVGLCGQRADVARR